MPATVTTESPGGVVLNVMTETSSNVLVPGRRKISENATNWALGAAPRMGESEIDRLTEPKKPSTLLTVRRAKEYCSLDKVSKVGENNMAKFPQTPVLSRMVSSTTVPP